MTKPAEVKDGFRITPDDVGRYAWTRDHKHYARISAWRTGLSQTVLGDVFSLESNYRAQQAWCDRGLWGWGNTGLDLVAWMTPQEVMGATQSWAPKIRDGFVLITSADIGRYAWTRGGPNVPRLAVQIEGVALGAGSINEVRGRFIDKDAEYRQGRWHDTGRIHSNPALLHQLDLVAWATAQEVTDELLGTTVVKEAPSSTTASADGWVMTANELAETMERIRDRLLPQTGHRDVPKPAPKPPEPAPPRPRRKWRHEP